MSDGISGNPDKEYSPKPIQHSNSELEMGHTDKSTDSRQQERDVSTEMHLAEVTDPSDLDGLGEDSESSDSEIEDGEAGDIFEDTELEEVQDKGLVVEEPVVTAGVELETSAAMHSSVFADPSDSDGLGEDPKSSDSQIEDGEAGDIFEDTELEEVQDKGLVVEEPVVAAGVELETSAAMHSSVFVDPSESDGLGEESESSDSEIEEGEADEVFIDPEIEEVQDKHLDVEEPCVAAEVELGVIKRNLDEAYRRLAASELQLRKERRKASRLEAELEESELDIQEIQNAQQSLSEWVRARNGSFAWQLSDALGNEREKAKSAKSLAEKWFRNGRNQTIKLLLPVESKHRLWPRFGALVLVIVGLVVLFQYLRNFRVFVWTQYIPTPWPMIGFASLVFLGLGLNMWLNYERAYASTAIAQRWEQREKLGIKGLDAGQHALALIDFARRIIVPIPLIVALWFAIGFARDLVPTVVQGFIPQPWVIWLTLAFIYIANILVAWYFYYKFLSQLRFQIINVLYEAKRQGSAYRHAATEEARLEAMHSLVPDYLEMLGKPINAPWVVDMSQVKAGEMRPAGDSLPASVGLAEATGGDSRQWNVMENKSRGLLYRPGWITNAFRRILEEIADFEGLNQRTLTPDSVAADPGDSRRGQRKFVSEMSTNSEILSATGRNQLRTLSEAIQKGVIREIKPLVTPLRPNELAELDISANRFHLENADQVPWDAFLEEALSEAAPFSMLTFSPTGIDGRSYHVKESRALVPKDLTNVQSTGKLKIIESEEGAHSTPLDMVIRIDRSDWLNPKDLLLFTEVQLRVTEESADLDGHESVFDKGDESRSGRIED